jgi:hypothetical protein
VLSYRPTETIFTGTRTQDRFSGLWSVSCNLVEKHNFGLGAVFLQRLVSELQNPPSPGLKLRTHSGIDLSEIPSCFQGIIMPSLVWIGSSILKPKASINTHISTMYPDYGLCFIRNPVLVTRREVSRRSASGYQRRIVCQKTCWVRLPWAALSSVSVRFSSI